MYIFEKEKLKRCIKATVVVIVIGFGWLQHNTKKYDLTESIYGVSILENNCVKTDTVKTNDGRILIYTKSLLKSGIQHLISNYENH
jgi:hypothetical protein